MNQIYINMWKNSQSNFMKLIEKMKMQSVELCLKGLLSMIKIEI